MGAGYNNIPFKCYLGRIVMGNSQLTYRHMLATSSTAFWQINTACFGRLGTVFAQLGVALSILPLFHTQLAGQSASPVAPLVRLLETGRIPPDRQPAIIEIICQRGGPDDLSVVFRHVLDPKAMSATLRRQSLQWLLDAALIRRLQPSGDLAPIVLLFEDVNLRLPAVRLAGAWNVVAAKDKLVALVQHPPLPTDIRRAAMESLIRIAPHDAHRTLVWLAEQATDPYVRQNAVAALAAVDLEEAAQWAARLLQQFDLSVDPATMLDALLERQHGAERLALALANATVHPDVAKRALRYLFSVGRNDPDLSAILSQLAGLTEDRPPPTPEEVAAMCQEVLVQGNAENGERVFRREDVNCFRCHSLNRAGGQIGPDLSAIGASSPLDYIVNSILNPNLAIKEQYLTRVFVTSDGRVLTGIVQERDDRLVRIKDAKGEILTIALADVEDEFEGPSMMPMGLTKFLTYQETLDLIRFVYELGKPGPYAPSSRKYAYRWRVLVDPPEELLREVPHLDQLRQLVFSAPESKWRACYSKFDGFLPLDQLTTINGLAALFLKTEVWVHEAGTARFEVETKLPWQAWVDEQPWLSDGPGDIALATGKHVLWLRVEQGGSDRPQLRVEWLPGQRNPANFEPVGGP